MLNFGRHFFDLIALTFHDRSYKIEKQSYIDSNYDVKVYQ